MVGWRDPAWWAGAGPSTQALIFPPPATVPQVFREQGIDGETLPLLTEEHLLTTMGLKLGPALKIRAQVSLIWDQLFPDNGGSAQRLFMAASQQAPTQAHLSTGGQAPRPSLLHGQLPCGFALSLIHI